MAARAAMFSKQDSRFEQTPEEFSVAQMKADLGDHRIRELPLSGRANPHPPPPPDVLKRGLKVARKALPDTVSATWSKAGGIEQTVGFLVLPLVCDPIPFSLFAHLAVTALFDPSLVVERNDGLGDGQSHRTGPNYRPAVPQVPRSRPGAGVRSLLGPSAQASSSVLRVSRSPPRGVRNAYPRAGPQTPDNFRSDKKTKPAQAQIGSNAFTAFISRLRSEPGAGPVSIRSVTREIPDNPSVSHWNSGNLVVANAKCYDYIQPDTPTAPRGRASNPLVAAERMNTDGPPMVLPKAPLKVVRKGPAAVETMPPALNKGANEPLRDPNGAGSADGSGGSPSPLGARPVVRLPAASSAEASGAAEAKQGFQKAALEISNRNALEATNGLPRTHPDGGAQTGATDLEATVVGPSPRTGSSPRTPPDIQELMEVLEKSVKLLSQSIAIYKLGSPESALSEGRHRATLEIISSGRNDLFEYILSEEKRLGEIKDFLKGIERKEKEIVKDPEVAGASYDNAKEDEGGGIVSKEAEEGRAADEEKDRLEKARREQKRLEEVHIEQELIEKERAEGERVERSWANQEKERLRQELLEQEGLSKERIEKENAEKAAHLEQPENESPNKELIVNAISTALRREKFESDQREELRANAEARELARLQGEILEENRRKQYVEGGDVTRLSRKEGEDHPAKVQLLEKPPNVESSTLAGARRYPAPLEPQENPRNAVPRALSSPPPFPYRVEIQLRPLFDKPSVVAWVDQFVEPQVAIDRALSEVLTEKEVSVLVGLPPFKLFLAKTVERHSRKMAKVHGST